MFYARLGQIKVDGNNPQGQGMLPRASQDAPNPSTLVGVFRTPSMGEVYLPLPPPLDTFGGSASKP